MVAVLDWLQKYCWHYAGQCLVSWPRVARAAAVERKVKGIAEKPGDEEWLYQ